MTAETAGLKPVRKPPDREEWLITFDRRVWFIGGYVMATFVASLVVDVWLPKTAAAMFTTIWQGESSYFVWRYLGYDLHPLKEYLPVVLMTGTIHLTAFWFGVFRKEASLLELPTVNRIFNQDRFPEFYNFILRRGYWGLFVAGLCPEIWPVGFLVQRNRPLDLGVPAILIGNGAKLAGWAFVCQFAIPAVIWKIWFFIPAILLVLVLLHLLPRLVARFLPRDGRASTLR
ncbi:MAG TPA: hypothetical protein VNK70_00565 [Candidatus Paceibacterota bacterium]|nr:hypothetical protein [Candidatus Paceibacterota bacterium]